MFGGAPQAENKNLQAPNLFSANQGKPIFGQTAENAQGGSPIKTTTT